MHPTIDRHLLHDIYVLSRNFFEKIVPRELLAFDSPLFSGFFWRGSPVEPKLQFSKTLAFNIFRPCYYVAVSERTLRSNLR